MQDQSLKIEGNYASLFSVEDQVWKTKIVSFVRDIYNEKITIVGDFGVTREIFLKNLVSFTYNGANLEPTGSNITSKLDISVTLSSQNTNGGTGGTGSGGTPLLATFSSTPTFSSNTIYLSKNITEPISIKAPTSGAVAGVTVTYRLIADGVSANTPTFNGFIEAQGNLGWDNAPGAINIVKFFYDGVSYWYTIFGAVESNPIPSQTISNLRTNAAGTQLLYDVVGSTITALSGNLNAGNSRTLTHVSNGVASISGTPLTASQTGLTATISISTPTLTTPITNSTVINNVPALTATPTNFRTSSDGTTLIWDNTTTQLTGYTATLNAGTVRTLTFISGTTATISGSPITLGQSGLTVTFTASTPALTIPINNVAVTNGATSALTKQAITYPSTPVVTKNGDDISFTGTGTSVNYPVNTANPFEIIIKSGKEADVFILDELQATTFGWTPAANLRVAGAYFANGNLYQVDGVNASTILKTGVTGNQYIKFAKSGADITISHSPDGVTYTISATIATVLTGQILFLNIYNVAGGICAPQISIYA